MGKTFSRSCAGGVGSWALVGPARQTRSSGIANELMRISCPIILFCRLMIHLSLTCVISSYVSSNVRHNSLGRFGYKTQFGISAAWWATADSFSAFLLIDVLTERPSRCGIRGSSPLASLQFLDVRQWPTLIEVRFQRRVESKTHEPCLAGHGLNPVFLKTFRRGRAEVNVHRAVSIFR